METRLRQSDAPWTSARRRVDNLPSFCVQPSITARAPSPRGVSHGFIFDEFGNREAIMGLHEGEILKAKRSVGKSLLPGTSQPRKQNVAPGERQIVIHLNGRSEGHGLFMESAVST